MKKAHNGAIWQLAWSHPADENILASCGYDQKVKLWKESEDGLENIHEFYVDEGSVNCIAWSPRELGQILVAGCSNGTVVYYECKDGESTMKKYCVKHSSAVNSISFGPVTNPTTINSNHDSAPPLRFVTSSCDQTVIEWTMRPEDQTLSPSPIGSHNDWVRDAAWAPNIGLEHEIVASCSEDKELKVWKKVATGAWEQMWATQLDGPGWRVGWSPSGGILSVTAGEKTLLYKKIPGSEDYEQIESLSDE